MARAIDQVVFLALLRHIIDLAVITQDGVKAGIACGGHRRHGTRQQVFQHQAGSLGGRIQQPLPVRAELREKAAAVDQGLHTTGFHTRRHSGHCTQAYRQCQ